MRRDFSIPFVLFCLFLLANSSDAASGMVYHVGGNTKPSISFFRVFDTNDPAVGLVAIFLGIPFLLYFAYLLLGLVVSETVEYVQDKIGAIGDAFRSKKPSPDEIDGDYIDGFDNTTSFSHDFDSGGFCKQCGLDADGIAKFDLPCPQMWISDRDRNSRPAKPPKSSKAKKVTKAPVKKHLNKKSFLKELPKKPVSSKRKA